VSITYNNTVSARLKPPGGAPVNTQIGTSSGARGAAQGHGGCGGNYDATVSAIDKGASSITFTGPNGWKYS
jgi:hypothetical protein